MKRKQKKQLPELEQLKKELRRERYKSRYAAVLSSTVSTLVVAAAFAVLVATLWMPVLQIYGNSMAPTLEEGQIVVSVKNGKFEQGDLVAFYIGKESYNQALNLTGNGIMGYVEIPEIDSVLPIYHGTDEAVLQIAVGHLEWTSLPVGGEGTHCVLSGHRGLPSAKLFTDLDKIVEGDVFILRILDEILTYEVDQILIVEPNVTDALRIEEGKDYCTLVTCTPYGINSHRLLVRGHRIENAPEARIVRITADAAQIEPLLVAPIVGIPLVLILMIPLMLPRRRRYR